MTKYARPVQPVQPTYKQTSHVTHLLLSVFTLGIWLMVWPFVALANNFINKQKRERYEQALAEYTRDMQLYEESRSEHQL